MIVDFNALKLCAVNTYIKSSAVENSTRAGRRKVSEKSYAKFGFISTEFIR